MTWVKNSSCMTWFEQLETHLHDLYLLNSPYAVDAFKPAFRSFFGKEHQTFKLKMFHNLDQLRLQLERENLHGVNAKTCLQALRTQFKEFLASKGVNATDLLNQGWQQDFEDFTRCEPSAYKRELLENLDTLEALHDEILHEHQIKSSVKMQSQDIQINPVQAMDDSLIVSKDIGPVNDEEPFAEVLPTQVMYICQSFKGKIGVLVTKTTNDLIRQEFKEFKSDEHASNDVWTKQFKPRSSSNDVWTKQFKPRSSSNDVWTKQFKPRSSSKDVWTKQFRPRKSIRLNEAEEECCCKRSSCIMQEIVSESDLEAIQEDGLLTYENSQGKQENEQETAGTGGSNKGNGNRLWVSDESQYLRASSEGTGSMPGF
ncbi:hypothetical protein Tco_0655970 [Tanacetum coccineum]|uniref:Retrotransposon gag domain-containing protein n=1 Tax=Tanacetum coccineum TaxID=301880 RepID=A0ABQ4X8P1_9ASTR